jgi:hypothetical protein
MRTTSREPNGTSEPYISKPNFSTTRRGLLAATALVASGLAAKTAHAMARPPAAQHHCFLSGTRIRTPKGEMAIDDLQVGDLVTTISGEAKPIKWIGRQSITREAGESWPTDTLPIRVARFALDDRTPHRDLFLSPGHSLYVDGLLIVVRNLANGRTIAPYTAFDGDSLEYLHIELDGHDVIFAEGTPTETLLAKSREQNPRLFDNWPEYDSRYGVAGAADAKPFAPVVLFMDGRALLRSRLRSAVSPLMDRRQPVDVVWDRLAKRAETARAA